MLLWLTKIKSYLVAALLVILGAVAIAFRFIAARYKSELHKQQAKTAQEARRADGAEQAVDVREKAEDAVRTVQERQKSDPPVDLTTKW